MTKALLVVTSITKGISDGSKTARPNQLDVDSKKRQFDKNGSTPDAQQPTCRGDPRTKAKSSILEPCHAI
ncbi:hypothetical protein RYX36_001143, partial [Vicia faba]